MSQEFNIFFSIKGNDEYSSVLNKTKQKTKEVGSEHDKTTKKINKNINSSKSELNVLNKSFSSLKTSIMSTVAAYIGFGAIKRATVDLAHFEKYMSKTKGISHATNEEMAILNKDIKEISKTSIAGIEELAKASITGASLGLNTKEITGMLKAASTIKAGYKDEISTEEISQMLAVLKKNFPDKEFSQMQDTISWMLDKVPNINFLELSNSIARSMPAAKQLGLSMEEVLSISSEDIVNIGGSMADRAMSQTLKVLRSKKNEISKTMKIPIADFNKNGSFIGMLTEIQKKTAKLDEAGKLSAIESVFGKGEVAQSIVRYIDSLDQIKKLYDDIGTNAKGFAQTVAKPNIEGFNGQVKQLSNAFAEFSLTLGVLVEKTQGIQYLKSIINGFTSAVAALGKAIDKIYKFGEKIGESVGKIIGKYDLNSRDSNLFEKISRNNKIDKMKFDAYINKADFTYLKSMESGLSNQNLSESLGQNNNSQQNIAIELVNKSNTPLNVNKIETKLPTNSIEIKKNDYFNR